VLFLKAGIMDEMVGETMDLMDEEEGLEEEADEEVEKVLFEITDGKLGQAGKVDQKVPVRTLILRQTPLLQLLLTRRTATDSDRRTGGRRRRRRTTAHASPARRPSAELTDSCLFYSGTWDVL
jgi:hypothetical protein